MTVKRSWEMKFWRYLGYPFAWIALVSLFQFQVVGYLKLFVVLFALVLLFFISKKINYWIDEHWSWFLSLVILLSWVYFAGTYSLGRDVLVIIFSFLVAMLIWSEGRAWLRSLLGDGAASFPGRNRIAISWLLISWFLASGMNVLLEREPLDLNGSVVKPQNMPEKYKGLRVGLALSGGGYRAALVHAGVLDVLGKNGIPVTNLATVSGGSVIGSYIALGGSPKAFVEAVYTNRFRYKRDLTDAHNVLRLPGPTVLPWLDVDVWPFSDFSRLDVQANLLDRVFLRGMSVNQCFKGPDLMIAMTDLHHGLSIGATSNGYLVFGPVLMGLLKGSQADAYENAVATFKNLYFDNSSFQLEKLDSLALRVAISGAFPGAFPPYNTQAQVRRNASLKEPGTFFELPLSLIDGGVRDNLGLSFLEVVNLVARKKQGEPKPKTWHGDSPGEKWKLDLIIASDGGQIFAAGLSDGVLESITRAIELNGLETGALRTIPYKKKTPVHLLSGISFSLTPDTIMQRVDDTNILERPEVFIRTLKIQPSKLLKLSEIFLNQKKAKDVRERYRNLDFKAFAKNYQSIAEKCDKHIKPERKPECVWYELVSLVGNDINETLNVFARTKTLQDEFDMEVANDLFRYGQYLATMKVFEIHQDLEKISVSH